MFLCANLQSKLTIDRFWKKSSFSDDMNDTLVNFIRLRAVFNIIGFEQILWNKLGGHILMIRIDNNNYDYFNVLICSSLIKYTSKILYNLYTTLLSPNRPFLGSWFVKNKLKTRIFQETTMRIRNARYCGVPIYQNYLDTRSIINVGCFYYVCFCCCLFVWLLVVFILFVCIFVSFLSLVLCYFVCLFLCWKICPCTKISFKTLKRVWRLY